MKQGDQEDIQKRGSEAEAGTEEGTDDDWSAGATEGEDDTNEREEEARGTEEIRSMEVSVMPEKEGAAKDGEEEEEEQEGKEEGEEERDDDERTEASGGAEEETVNEELNG